MHAVERKLRYEIAPYLVTARRLGNWRPLWIYLFYVYCGEIFVLLGGFGLANPVLTFLTEGQLKGQESNSSVVAFLGSATSGMLALILLVIWGILKFHIRKEDLEKRCSLLLSCRLQCAQISHKTQQVLTTENPMPALLDIQAKLSDLIDRNIIERAWPYDGPEPGIEAAVDAYCNPLVSQFGPVWTVVSQNRSG